MKHFSLTVGRFLKYKDFDNITISAVELETPKKLTWSNFNTRQWSINKLVVKFVYIKLMIAMGFVMEGLQFDPQDWQNVLMIGLGGGTVATFSVLSNPLRVNLTTIELDPLMVTIAKDWFGLHETPLNTVILEDGVKFLHEAAERGQRISIMSSIQFLNNSLQEGRIMGDAE
ncbi:hypothetical protein COOONC_21524, partial [Cooperia oncophora]